MIDRALGIMDASKDLPPAQQFVWTSPGWVMEKVLEDWPGPLPERRQRIETAFKSGKFVTHALPFSIEAELLEPEQFARGYVFADTISRRYGLPLARGAKTTDVPSQSPSLATGLARGGVKFMHIGCNWPSGYVHDLPPIFWWEGPDGSRLLTMYSSIYGTSTAFWAWGGKADRNVGHNLLPPPDWPYKTWVAIIVTGDNSGPPQAEAGMSKPGLPSEVPYRAAAASDGSLRITRHAAGEHAVLECAGDSARHLPASSLRVSLYRGLPYVELELTIKDKPKDNWPEADWLCLPFKISEPQFCVAGNLGVMDPANDILRGAN
jgi:hypothetical protein